LNNEFELLRLKQSLWERYFYYFDSIWYTCQTSIKFLASLPGTVELFQQGNFVII